MATLGDLLNSPDFTDMSWDDILKQFQPSAQDKSNATNKAIITASLGLLANANKPLVMGVGQGGLLGAQSYNQDIAQAQQQRAANLAQAAQVYKISRDAKMQNMGMNLVNQAMTAQGGMPPGPPQGAPQSPPQPNPSYAPLNGAATALGMAGSPAAPAVDMASQVTPQNLPQTQTGAPPSAPSFPNWASTIPPAAIGARLMGQDYKGLASDIMDADKLVVGKNGELTKGGMLVGRATPEGTVMYPGGDVSKAYFINTPASALAASVNQQAALEGAKASATSAAEFPYKTMTVRGADNKEKTDYTQNILGAPPVAAPAPAVGGAVPTTTVNLQPPSTPGATPITQQALAWMANDMGQGQGSPRSAPGPVIGPNPVDVAAQTTAAQDEAKNLIEFKQNASTAALQAKQSNASIDQTLNYLSKITGGPLTPLRMEIGSYPQSVANSMGSDSTIGSMAQSAANAVAGPNAKEAIPNYQALDKILTQQTGGALKAGFGTREAAQIVTLVRNAWPNAQMVDGGPQKIAQFMKGVNNYQIATATAAQQWEKDHAAQPVPMKGFQEDWAASHPISDYIPPIEDLNALMKGQKPSAATAKVMGAPSMSDASVQQSLSNARAAIAAGKDAATVKSMLRAHGIDPGGL